MSDFSKNANMNIKLFENKIRMSANFDILKREVKLGEKTAGLFFIDGFVKEEMVERLMQFFYSLDNKCFEDIDKFLENGMPYTEIEKNGQLNDVVKKFMSGISVMIIDGFDECILVDCRTYPVRSVSEPWKDRVLRGSRDGFVETLVSNAALIRRRIRDTKLSMEMYTVGTRSASDVAICYIEDKADKRIVDRVRSVIQGIETEALTMNIESLAECMFQGKWINPMPKYKYSERPDTAAAAILDGNVVIMVDNSPAVMILPATVFDIIEEADDYNFSPLIGTYIRLSRFFFTFLTVYMTPIWLLLNRGDINLPHWLGFLKVSDSVTVPIILQLIILELAVDGLKLAAVNTPNVLSTPLSIVAGIVVGEYAVQSGWFNSESLLYMAVVTVGTYSQASFEMGYALKFLRIVNLILVQFVGGIGLAIGVIVSICTIAFNRTLIGTSYIYPLVPFNFDMLKRKILRIRLPHNNK